MFRRTNNNVSYKIKHYVVTGMQMKPISYKLIVYASIIIMSFCLTLTQICLVNVIHLTPNLHARHLTLLSYLPTTPHIRNDQYDDKYMNVSTLRLRFVVFVWGRVVVLINTLRFQQRKLDVAT